MSIRDFPYMVNTERYRLEGKGPWGGWPQLDAWRDENLQHFLFPLETIVEGCVEYRYRGGVSPDNGPGIYFLMMDGLIGYVGRAVSLAYRLDAHFLEGTKPFTHYWCIQGVPREILDDVENMYLEWLQPPMNAKFLGCCDKASELIAGLEPQIPLREDD